MNNAFYVTLSRQATLFRDMDAIANNIANANTTGYKSEKIVFTDFLHKDVDNEEIAFAQDIFTIKDMSPGAFVSTGAPLDVAIEGDGFFSINTQEGTRYTKAGSFTLNTVGEIITSHGDTVQAEGGSVLQIPEGASNISIRQDGMVQAFVDNTLEEIGRINVVKFENPQELVKVGGGYFDGPKPILVPLEELNIIQGSIEQSNVNTVEELTNMINTSRSMGSTARMMKDLHELIRDAVQKISRQG